MPDALPFDINADRAAGLTEQFGAGPRLPMRLANASGQHRVLTVDERDFPAYRLKQGKRFDRVKWT